MVTQLDSSYLDDASQRIANMTAIAAPNVEVTRYIDKNLTPPFFWVYLGRMKLSQKSEEISLQEYTVVVRYVIGYLKEGFSGERQQELFSVIPTVHNYLYQHKNLIYLDLLGGQPFTTSPKFLEIGRVMVDTASTFGAYQDGTDQVGIELTMFLPFRVLIPSDKE